MGGKQNIDPPMPIDDDKVHEKMVESKDIEIGYVNANDGVSDEVVMPKKLKPVARPPPPFPQRLKKKEEEGIFQHFISILKQLPINIPLIKALKRMPRYVKFMKDLVMKKRTMHQELS